MGGISYDRLKIITEAFIPDGTDHWDCDGNSLELETGLFLYSVVRRVQPKVIVETVTWKGVSTGFMACALADIYESYTHRAKGKIYTVDLDESKNVGCAVQLWQKLGVTEYISGLVGRSTELIPGRAPVDMFFLDANHEYDEITKEWAHLKKYIGNSGVLIGHDTALQEHTHKATMNIASSLPGRVQVMEITNMRGFIMLQWSS